MTLHRQKLRPSSVTGQASLPCVLRAAVKSPFLPAKACERARNSTRMALSVGSSSVSIRVPNAWDLLDDIALYFHLPRLRWRWAIRRRTAIQLAC